MINIGKEWNPKQALLRQYLTKSQNFNESINLCLEMHILLHSSEMSNCKSTTYFDILWNNLAESVFRLFVKKSGTSIAWNIWHLTRIEDITANILIANENQVINNDWLKKINTDIRDTGNSMTDDEIIKFNNEINIKQLYYYRIAVGIKTQSIIKKLKSNDLKRKMDKSQLVRIIDEGGVLEHEKSKWLIDFWGKKNVSGILLMPITRHQVVHLNDSLRIKEKNKEK